MSLFISYVVFVNNYFKKYKYSLDLFLFQFENVSTSPFKAFISVTVVFKSAFTFFYTFHLTFLILPYLNYLRDTYVKILSTPEVESNELHLLALL